jgi:hypothetical protein
MQMPVWHWTAGRDSYNICKDRGLCQFLLPKEGAPWQFAEVDAVCYHASSAVYGHYNDDGPGMEIERLNGDDPLSPDQVMWSGRIVDWLAGEWGVPATHYWGPRFPWHQADYHGHVNHAQLHANSDGLSREEWDLITAGASPAPVPAQERHRMEMIVGPLQGQTGNVAILLVADKPKLYWSAEAGHNQFGVPLGASDYLTQWSRGVQVSALINDGFGLNAGIMQDLKDAI